MHGVEHRTDGDDSIEIETGSAARAPTRSEKLPPSENPTRLTARSGLRSWMQRTAPTTSAIRQEWKIPSFR
jgi:hypothetical protein